MPGRRKLCYSNYFHTQQPAYFQNYDFFYSFTKGNGYKSIANAPSSHFKTGTLQQHCNHEGTENIRLLSCQHFYQNKRVIAPKKSSEAYDIEIKSAKTGHADFEKVL